ncbi:DUF3313 family protein [Serratia bockelmannii]|uniref:DUF3313 family protein n=1 Tax=Serratia bockelmannii TaxID=2703793 RepID=UPI003FA684BC
MRSSVIPFFFLVPIFISSCASTNAPEKSSLIENYQQLQPKEDGSRSYVRKGEAGYSVVKLLPALYQPMNTDDGSSLTKAEMDLLLSGFGEDLKREFRGAGIALTEQPEQNTVCVQPYIYSVHLTNKWMNIATSAALIGPVSNGGVGTVIDAYECKSHTRLAAEVRDVKVNAFSDMTSSYSKTGHVTIALSHSAKSFTNLLRPLFRK